MKLKKNFLFYLTVVIMPLIFLALLIAIIFV